MASAVEAAICLFRGGSCDMFLPRWKLRLDVCWRQRPNIIAISSDSCRNYYVCIVCLCLAFVVEDVLPFSVREQLDFGIIWNCVVASG